ncbi:MAG: hypothetical protein AAGD22_14815 [Verrucomicrobiota bacterium]
MKNLVRHILPATLSLIVAFLVALAPHSARAETKITKVKKYHLTEDAAKYRGAIDQMISFERKYRLWGTVTQEERNARLGQYFTFMWRTKDKSTPATIRFEYRQQATNAEILVREVEVTNVKGLNSTDVNIIGEEYAANGQVMSWRASIIRGGQTVASAQSFLWE